MVPNNIGEDFGDMQFSDSGLNQNLRYPGSSGSHVWGSFAAMSDVPVDNEKPKKKSREMINTNENLLD